MIHTQLKIARKIKMQKNIKRNLVILFALTLVITIAIPLVNLPEADAHTPPWIFTTQAYISAAPNPVGVGQQALIYVWLQYTIQGVNIANDIRFRDYQLTITKPDGNTETINWPIVVDTTSSAYTPYTPEQIGEYTLTFNFPGQTFDYGGAYDNDTYTPSTATMTLTVQQDPIPKLPETPLPTEYWSRPINGQNHDWDTISSNWLGGSATNDIWQKNGAGPRSAHVMWAQPLEFGGMVGGGLNQVGGREEVTDLTYYSGFSYNTRFGSPIIMNGILYYRLPMGERGSGGGVVAVDLQTGEKLWSSDTITPSFGQLYNFQSPNQHGVVGAILWQTSGSTWIGYNQFTMQNIINLTSVPSGTEEYGNDGSIVRYVFSYNTTSREGTLKLWNNTAAITSNQQLYGGPAWPNGNPVSINANTDDAYSWSVPITADLTGSSSPAIVGTIPGEILLGRSSTVTLTSTPRPNDDPWTMWAISLKPESRGHLLWIKEYPAPANNITRMLKWQPIDPVTRAWSMTDFETGQATAYSMDTGDLIWGPLGDQPGFQYYSTREGQPAYGNLYVGGYGGVVFCYSMTNGTLLWTYGNGGEGNSTNSGDETPWGNYPSHIAAFADGMVFTMSGEHSPNTPLYKGYRARAIDAFTGTEIWTLLDWSASGLGTSLAPVAIADGYMSFTNAYDGRVYTVGKGPTQMTVTAPDTASPLGSSITIKGTIMDISAGTEQKEQAARFPNGVAVVSDESQTAWMEYVYMQQPRPMDTMGVPVVLSVVDANGNYREIGETISTDGFYSLNWKPDIEGQYTLYASFGGSESYWPSNAITAFSVDPAAPTTAPTEAPPQSTADMYFVPAVAGIIVAIAIGFVITILLVLRRRP